MLVLTKIGGTLLLAACLESETFCRLLEPGKFSLFDWLLN